MKGLHGLSSYEGFIVKLFLFESLDCQKTVQYMMPLPTSSWHSIPSWTHPADSCWQTFVATNLTPWALPRASPNA